MFKYLLRTILTHAVVTENSFSDVNSNELFESVYGDVLKPTPESERREQERCELSTARHRVAMEGHRTFLMEQALSAQQRRDRIEKQSAEYFANRPTS